MKIRGIDEKRCAKCGSCVTVCPANLFSMRNGENTPVRQDPHNWCTGCGHCISVCRADAVVFEADGKSDILHRTEDTANCSYEDILAFMRTKRSIRNYLSREVPDEEVDAIIEAMRIAPTGHNMQANRYIVIRDRSVIEELRKQTVRGFNGFKKVARSRKLLKPFINSHLYGIMNEPGLIEGLDSLIDQYEEGGDPVFHHAPVLIAVYCPNLGPLSFIDPTIGFTYGMLAAHARGLGTCWIGFAIQALWKNGKMKKHLGIPKDMIIAGVMTLGYPSVKFHYVPPRNAAQVTLCS